MYVYKHPFGHFPEQIKLNSVQFDITPNFLLCVAVFFPFLLPVLQKLKVSFFPKDVMKFFSDATTKAIEARKESGQVSKKLYKFQKY